MGNRLKPAPVFGKATRTITGGVELATNAETVIGADTTKVTTPANITAKMAAPGAIGGTTPGTGSFTDLAGTFKEYPPSIPIGWDLDGASPPDAEIVLINTFKIPVREFRGDTGNQDVYVPWRAVKDLTGGTIKFRVSGYVTNATAPADGETVIFTLAGSARAVSQNLNKAMGTAVSATFTADATYVQYDEWATGWSGDVTITDLAADMDVMLQLIRDQANDTYGQKIGVAWIEIEFTRTVSN